MFDILKIFLIFILILILLKKKINIGYAMLIASVSLALLYLMPFSSLFLITKNTFIDKVTIKLFLALTLIRSFELILREKKILIKMMNAAKILFIREKAVIISMPLLMGLLPSIGGAYFSAPMVDEATKNSKFSQEEKAFINYWFRHPWEFILPLYPGIVLASAISNFKIGKLIFANLSYAICLILAGFLFSMKGATSKFLKSRGISKKELLSFFPIITVLILVIIFQLEIHYALLITMFCLFIYYKSGIKEIIRVFKYGFTKEVLVLIIGVMLFKEMIETSGAVKNISGFLIAEKIPLMPIFSLLPFFVGLLTGLTVGFVGSTFPFILSIADGNSLYAISFAFASGFIGVLLSPVHICLVVTREYFKAEMWSIYKRILPAVGIIFCVAVIEYLILSL